MCVCVCMCVYIYIYTHMHTFIHTNTHTHNLHAAAAIAVSIGTCVASSVSSTTPTSLSGALGVVQQAQFVAIAGKVGSGGAKSSRRQHNAGKSFSSGAKTYRRQEDAAQPEGNSELSGALSWVNFHWFTLSQYSECISVDGTDL